MAVGSKPVKIIDALSSDPLGAVARRERGKLFIVSLLAFVVSRGLMPSKINSIGLEFNTQQDRILILSVLLAIQTYYLFGFFTYLGYDLINWLNKVREAIMQENKPKKLGIGMLDNSDELDNIRALILCATRPGMKRDHWHSLLDALVNRNNTLKELATTGDWQQREEQLKPEIDTFNSQLIQQYLQKNIFALLHGRTAIVRVLFDLILPALVGITSMVFLILFLISVIKEP